jgi:hypothetical protein
MTTHPLNSSTSAPFPGSADETLRIVAGLPAPSGLEDRVRAALHHAQIDDNQRQPDGSGVNRRGRVLAWPSALKPQTGWMRTAAAAAIVFVVAGGGWGVYTRVEQNRPAAKILVMPPRLGAPGGFSPVGAVRTPETLTGPKVIPVTPVTAAQAKSAKNAAPKAAGANPVVPAGGAGTAQ